MISKLPVTKRSNQVAEYFESLIRKGVYKPGDKLPTLQEMAEVLDVSKSTIREGLAALAAIGVIDVRHGSGYFVREAQTETEEGQDTLHDLGQVLFVRQLLEVSAARLAAQHRTPDQLQKMENCLKGMREGPVNTTIAADLGLHQVIAEASGNMVLANVIGSLSEPMQATMKLSRALAGTEGDLYAKHLELFHAIEQHDVENAARLMYEHLFETAERLKVLVPEMRARRPF